MPGLGLRFGKPAAVGFGECRQPLVSLPFAHPPGAQLFRETPKLPSFPTNLWSSTPRLQPQLLQERFPGLAGIVESAATLPSGILAAVAEQTTEPDPKSPRPVASSVLDRLRAEGEAHEHKAKDTNDQAQVEPQPSLQTLRPQAFSRSPEPTATFAIYEANAQKLEFRCRELLASNVRLQSALDEAGSGNEKMRGLNARLAQEAQEARRRATNAEIRVKALGAELNQVRAELRAAKRRANAMTKASAKAQIIKESNAENLGDSGEPVETETVASTLETSASLAEGRTSPEPCPSECDNDDNDDNDCYSVEVSRCACDEVEAWGCWQHSVYSLPLLLAHRDISIVVERGPPGLEASAHSVGAVVSLPHTVLMPEGHLVGADGIECARGSC